MSVVFIPRTLPANVLEGQSNQYGRGFEEGQGGEPLERRETRQLSTLREDLEVVLS